MSKEEIPYLMFMCSELYIAGLEGRTVEVTRLLAGSSHATTARANAVHPGRCCTTREVAAERSTLLHIAAGQGHCDLITELCLRDSALLLSVNSSLDTPLHYAAREGQADAVETIVRLARCSVEEDRLPELLGGKNDAGDTALHVAARHGHGETVEVLMKLAPELAAEVNGAAVTAVPGGDERVGARRGGDNWVQGRLCRWFHVAERAARCCSPELGNGSFASTMAVITCNRP